MRRVLSALLVLSFVLLSGCRAPVRSFSLTVGSESVELNEKPGRWPPEEGMVPAVFPDGSGYELRIDGSDGEAIPQDRYLRVSYEGNARGAYVEVLSEAGAVASVDLPKGGGALSGDGLRTNFIVPLANSREFQGIRVARRSPGEEFRIVGLAIVPPWRGVSLGDQRLTLTAGSSLTRDLEARAWKLSLPQAQEEGGPLVLTYTAASEVFSDFLAGPVSARLELSDRGGEHRTYALRLRPGTNSVQIYPWFAGFAPRELAFFSQGVTVNFDEASWGQSTSSFGAMPAELGTVLHYPAGAVQGDYALFRWNIYPEVLLFDFRSYEVQSRYLKRLAFFVEKTGYRGRVPTYEEIAHRHGWNAHNYSPDALSRFFSEASRLSAEEEALRLLALEEGLILPAADNAYQPGAGGVLSVSQESTAPTRRLLLTHEALHGVFYSEKAFSDAVWEVWEAQSDAFRDAWRRFLASMTYDPADEYLMVNEFQAYLLQQPFDEVQAYVGWRVAERLRSRDPGAQRYSDAFLRSLVEDSVKAARRLNEALFRSTGLLGGDVLGLVPAEPRS